MARTQSSAWVVRRPLTAVGPRLLEGSCEADESMGPLHRVMGRPWEQPEPTSSLLTAKMRYGEPASLGSPYLLMPSANPVTWGRGRQGIGDPGEGDGGGKVASMGQG